jgi:ABC-type multidrug transport system fused ATPase/permease subunit
MTDLFKKLNEICTSQQKRKAALLLICMLVSAAMEMIGIASVLPFMMILSDPTIIEENQHLNLLYSAFGFSSQHSFLVFLGSLVFTLILLSNSVKAYTAYAIIRFSNTFSHDLSVRLITLYMNRPYEWFLQKTSSDLAKILLAEVTNATKQIIMPVLQSASHILLLGIIIALLLNINAQLTFMAFIIFGTLYVILYGLARKRMNYLGKERLATNRQRFKIAHEALAGIKDIKIRGAEKFFTDRYKQSSKEFSAADIQAQTINQLPRFLLEALGFGGIILMTLYLYSKGDGLVDVLPTLTLFAFAAYKLLPAFQQLYQNLSTISFGKPVLEQIAEDLAFAQNETNASNSSPPLSFHKNIVFDKVCFSYPKSDRSSLHNIDIEIQMNTTVALIGKTGSGKSTIIDLLSGLLLPSDGSIMIDGEALDARNIRDWQKRIGYVPQHVFLTNETVLQNIALGIERDKIDMSAVINAAKAAKIHDFIIDKLPQQYETGIGERGIRLSGGERQRLGIARALYHNPDILIFDEATSALDNITEQSVIDAIQSMTGEKTIIMVAHRLSTIEKCEYVYIIDNGTIKAKGTYNTLLNDNNDFQMMLHAQRTQND